MATCQPLSEPNSSCASINSSMLNSISPASVFSSTTAATTTHKLFLLHPLQRKWTLWTHLPQKNLTVGSEEDWSLASYLAICTFETMEDLVAVMESIPDKVILNSMLFIMREGVKPMWEDSAHRSGGSFSFKIPCKHACNVWRHLSYVLAGETVSQNTSFMRSVTGITISPKRGSNTVKIWMATTAHQNPQMITADIRNLTLQGCLFSEFERHKKFKG